MQRGKIFLEYFFKVRKVLDLIEEISASMAPDFILEAHSLMTVGAVVIGTHTTTRSASLTQLFTVAHKVTRLEGFQKIFLSYARILVSDFLEKYFTNHEPILPPAPITATCWTISVNV
jgi:hypothetical protein